MALNLQPPKNFLYSEETRGSAGQRWTKWCQEFDLFVLASGLGGGGNKEKVKHLLLYCMGEKCRDIFSTVAENRDDAAAIMEKLKLHFSPKVGSDFLALKFYAMKQQTESVADFAVRLRTTAMEAFGEASEEKVRMQIIMGASSVKLREEILKATTPPTIQQIIALATAAETAKLQMAAIERTQTKPESFEVGTVGSKKECFKCGRDWPHQGDCPALGKKCNNCGELGHFAKFCKQKKSGKRQERQKPSQRQSRKEPKPQSSQVGAMDGEGEDNYFFAIDDQNSEWPVEARPRETVRVNDVNVEFVVDSGSPFDIIDEATWRSRLNLELDSKARNIFAYGGMQIDVVGEFVADVGAYGRTVKSKFRVARGRSGCLLSFGTARRLGLFQREQFEPVASLGPEPNEEYVSLMEEFPEVFNESVPRL